MTGIHQTFEGPIIGDVAGRDVIKCHGAATCPLHSANSPESKLQAEFYERTGMWAPPGAREKMEMLMAHHGFTAPRLRAAWKESSLSWDVDKHEFIAKAYWFEPVYGYSIAILMAVLLAAQGVAVTSLGQNSPRALMALATMLAMYGGTLWIAVRFVLTPYRVAKRVQKVLKKETFAEAP